MAQANLRVLHPVFAGGTPSSPFWGVPRSSPGQGTPLSGTGWSTPWKGTSDQWNYYGMEMGYPPRKDMGPVEVEVLWDGDRVPPKQTHTSKKITSCSTTYASHKNRTYSLLPDGDISNLSLIFLMNWLMNVR